GLEVFVVACPKCLTMFDDAHKTSGFEDKFVVRELIELINDCVVYDEPDVESDVVSIEQAAV
ncbi:MAG: Fe-S oxidoreductase, partial [Methylophagaceae bacterium]